MKVLRQNWWILAVQGLILIVVGAIGIFDPNVFLKDIVQYLGVIFLLFGFLLGLFAFLFRKKAPNWSFMFVAGLLQFLFGLAIVGYPDTSADIFTYVVAGWAFIIGLVQLTMALAGRGSMIMNLVNAVISLAFSALVIWNPFETADALTYIIAFYSIVLGLMVLYYAFNFRSWSERKLQEKEREQNSLDDKSENLSQSSD